MYLLTRLKNLNLYNDSVRPASQVSECSRNFKVTFFLDTMNMINVKLCVMVVFTELYPFIPFSVTMIVFQGHSSVEQF